MSQTQLTSSKDDAELEANAKLELQKKLQDRYWRLNNLYWITTGVGGEKVKFKMNWAQKLVYKYMWYMNIILKARQLGMSTFILIFILDACLFNKNIKAGVIAHTKDDVKVLFRDKIKFAYDNLDPFIRNNVSAKTDSANELVFSNGSSVRVGTSMRSGTLQILHVCLSGDTEILTKDGIIKKIKDITNKDLVMTCKGSYQAVKKLIKNRIKDIGFPLLAIKTFGYYDPLKITSNHSVLCREHATGKAEWRQAGEIVAGDYIAFPIREPSMKLKTGDLPLGGWRCKDRVKVDYDFGYLVGLYLAEGHIRRSEMIIAGDRAEDIGRLEKLHKLDYLFDSMSVYHSKTSKTSSIRINGRKLCNFMVDKFNKDGDKYIPDSVWNWGREFLDGMIKGYFDGDGSYLTPESVQVTSIRRQLLDQMRLLLISLRIGYPSMYHRPAGIYYGRNCKETWVLKLYGPCNWKFREYFGLELPSVNSWAGQWRIDHGRRPEGRKHWRRGADYYWARVTSTDIIEDEEFVYDIALENEPHNYVTVNGVVHNSEFGKICKKFPEKAREIVTGSFETVHPGQMIFVESTAEGREGYFYQMAVEARDLLSMIKSGVRKELSMLDFKLHFFPWWRHPGNVLHPEGTIIPPKLKKYFDEKIKPKGIKLTAGQMAWYAKKWKTLGSDVLREHPAFFSEAFERVVEGAYYGEQIAKARLEGRIGRFAHNPGMEVETWWDLGVNDRTVIWFTQTIGNTIYVIDFYENAGEGVRHYIEVLEERSDELGYKYGRHTWPHDGGHMEFSTGQTRKERATDLGLQVFVSDRGGLQDGIEQCRNTIPMCYFDEERCYDGITHLESYRKEWDENLGDWRKTPRHDIHSHGADGFRTLAMNHHAVATAKRRTTARKVVKANYHYG